METVSEYDANKSDENATPEKLDTTPDEFTTLYIIGYKKDSGQGKLKNRLYLIGKTRETVEERLAQLQEGNHLKLRLRAKLTLSTGVSDIEKGIRIEMIKSDRQHRGILTGGRNWHAMPLEEMIILAKKYGMELVDYNRKKKKPSTLPQ